MEALLLMGNLIVIPGILMEIVIMTKIMDIQDININLL